MEWQDLSYFFTIPIFEVFPISIVFRMINIKTDIMAQKKDVNILPLKRGVVTLFGYQNQA
jgi:hypothetical protein